VLCDKRMSIGLKDKVYRMIVRSAVLYGSECWPIKKTQDQRLTVEDMRIIRLMYGYMIMDRISN